MWNFLCFLHNDKYNLCHALADSPLSDKRYWTIAAISSLTVYGIRSKPKSVQKNYMWNFLSFVTLWDKTNLWDAFSEVLD